MAGGSAHDFNNLLMAILGNADLALEEMGPEAPGREFVDKIEKAAQSAAGLTNQMLAYSGKVDMYTLQRLLTHKSPQMTQRYAHLRDDVLKKASNLTSDIVSEAVKINSEKSDLASFTNHQKD